MANGLQVLLLPDPSEAKVTVNITILVGSRHEGLGETGMAHLLEHMVFKGTPTFPNVPKSLSEHGADFNGTTWLDRTNYFETMPASNDNLEFGIQLEADRLVNSNVKREDLVSEMTVVRNEFEMGENNPEAILSQRMNAVAYEWHNYGKSTIGNRSDIERVPVENLQQFYKKYYQPDNAVLIVAGKFDEKKALELIGKYFGKLKKPTRVLPKTYSEEPAQDGERIAVLRRVGKVGAAGLLYHIPAFVHPDYPVIELLEDVLSRDSGRLHKALIDTKLATTLNGTSYGLHDPGYLEEFCKCTPQNVDKVLDTMVNVVEGIAQQPITEEELKISKQRFTKFNEQLVSKTSNFAIRLSEAAACGDYRLFFLHRDRAEQVTLEDINRVAKTYLIRSNRTMGKYYPTAKPERAKIPATPEIATVLKDYKGRAAMTLGEAFIPTPENIEKRVVRGQIDSIKTAFITKKTKGEVVDLHLNLRFGNEETLKGKNKSIDLLGDLLMRGTATKTRKQIQDELDALGSNLSVGADLGLLTVSIHSKKSKLLPTLAILEDVLRHPGFNVEEFELLKNEYRERLTKGKTDPQALAMREMRRRLNPFPKDNIRYTPTVDEELERLDSTTLESLKEIYSQFSAQTGELAIVGDFEPEVVQPAIKKLILGWTTTVAYKRVERPAVKDILSGKEVINTPDKENAVYLAGLSFPMTDSDPQYPAMRIGNFILGEAPLASRISVRVRGEKGLSYGAGSFTSSSPKDKNSSFTMYAITNPNNMGKVNATIAEELNKFLKEGLSLDELDKGKASLLESMKLQHADDNVLANDLANGLFLGRTFDYYKNLEKQIQDVKAEEVQKAFQENVKPERLIIIEAGDFKKK
ncbi:insulinase family protein [Telmatocola sphagniphila]|uniref:Insulinase family protein n=2 Tax=Telmatocola sphagniphila TaxID=1123043 RepID=A0A8E6F0N7_9BACT|nr:insulinase family protein [Telmatocola sphagniphila]